MKLKKDPLPMKFRAFPQSFWQQPNKTQIVSPGTVYFVEDGSMEKEDIAESKGSSIESTHEKEEVITQPNIDLLFSLFQNVFRENRTRLANRRGRPKGRIKIIRDDDPYLTESCLPPLSGNGDVAKVKKNKVSNHPEISAMVSLKNATNLSNSTNDSKNYSKILSDLVIQL
ncbi:hypothetical protein RI129_006658 [Pyrocoelia pectoralis]|uniref:Uncharacterized protein n=1 Tax=Pyrocoelia pectoralis TaxID=417401 RepID=A0AAN7VEK0_9COLE